MKKVNQLFVIIIFLVTPLACHSQILISLLFGDALNSEKVEFGMTGGFNRSDFRGVLGAKGLNNFNIGMYFNIKLMENSYLSTGLLGKSGVGATNMSTSALDDQVIDGVFQKGTLTTKINYFHLPVMWQQRMLSRWLFEVGFQAGLRVNAVDFFNVESNGGTIELKRKVRKEFTAMDIGLLGGIGYKLKAIPKGMSVGLLYYYGLVDVRKDPSLQINNTSLYVYLRIPIGVKV